MATLSAVGIAGLSGCGASAEGSPDAGGGGHKEAGPADGAAGRDALPHEGGGQDTGSVSADTGSAGDGSAGDSGMISDAGLDGPLPDACVAAMAAIDWTDAGANCLGTPTGWAAGQAATWQDLFVRQCATTVEGAACAKEATAYFDCLSAEGGSCTPCITPNQGECKGSAGVVYSTCGSLETMLAMCACKAPGASCTSDIDCCGATGLALTCSGGRCAY